MADDDPKRQFAETAMLPHAPGATEHRTLVSDAAPTGEPSDETSEALNALGPGSIVGHFLLEKKLGEGGMGVVFLAKDRRLHRQVAIKILRLSRSSDTDATQAQQRMLREAQAMAMLSHPNLVTIYEVGTFAKSVFLALEYVTGTTLEDWLQQPRPLEDIFDVFEQAGRALSAVHDAGLVHRDFKPANVVVTEDGTAKVLDLGIARKVREEHEGAHGLEDDDALEPKLEQPMSVRQRPKTLVPRLRQRLTTDKDAFDSQLTQDGAIVGTPAYMAPEQLLGSSVGPAADQFSFAIALFEALTGERPFAGNDPLSIMANIVGDERKPWPSDTELPLRLREAIERALHGDPEQRFPGMAEFMETCQQALGLRGQIRFLTKRWLSNDRNPDYLLPDGARLTEGRELLAKHPDRLSADQAEFVGESLRAAKKKQLQRRALLGGVAVLGLGLVPTAWLLDRRSRQLEAATRAELSTEIAALRERVESAFARSAEHTLLMFAQRDVWLGQAMNLAASGAANDPDVNQRLRNAVDHLNSFFRPVVERNPTISSLMVARDDGLEYLVFDDPDARKLIPPYRFYNRVVYRKSFSDSAFQLFWPPKPGAAPRSSWLHAGEADSRGQPWTGYFPTRRPWFKNASSNPGPSISWTKPYLFFVTKDAGITGSIAWKHQGHVYVLGVDFMLTHISNITATLRNPRFYALITTRGNELVGLPDGERFGDEAKVREFFSRYDASRRAEKAQGKVADVAAELPTVDELGMAPISEALKAAKTASTPIFAFEVERRTLWAATSPVGDKEQGMTLHVVERFKS